MKKIFSFLILGFLCCIVFAQKQYLSCALNANAYATNSLQPYIEFQFLINGKTTQYAPNARGKFNAAVEVRVDIKTVKDERSIDGLHYILNSADFEDTIAATKPYFSDVQNVKVDTGAYYLYYTLVDIHKKDTISYIDYIDVKFPKNEISLSKISLWQWLDPTGQDGFFEKYGYAVTPLFQQYAPEKQYTLPFTVEIYNTDKVLGNNSEFMVRTSIVPEEFYRAAKPQNIFYKTLKSKSLTLFLHQFDIYDLPSGNYNVVVEILNKDSVVVASSNAYFQRNNPAVKLDPKNYDDVIIDNTFVEKMTDLKQLQDDVASLYPIGSRIEQEFFLQRMKKVPLEQLQRYFYSFWAKRDANDPEGAWLEYKKKVDYVQEKYGSTVIRGYRTDRGRVYLRYGPPTHITEEPYDPNSYPYEIWQYYVIGNQTNKKFVFYNKDLISNNYELLHSDMIGETYDPGWQMKLVRRLSPNNNPDITVPDEYWGGGANDRYKYDK